MSTLSNVDIEREIYQGNILIYPFFQRNLKGSSYNLTVSKIAYKIAKNGTSLHYESAYDEATEKVIIPANSIVIIWTNESIYVSYKITGSYHSKVELVAKSLGHIGTTLDPNYIGPSAITVQNHSDYPIELKPEKDTFVTLTFQYLHRKANKGHGNDPGRPELAPNKTEDDKKWLNEDFRKDQGSLKVILNKEVETSDYKEMISKLRKNSPRHRLSFLYPYLIYSGLIIVIFSFNIPFSDKMVLGLVGAASAQLVNDVKRKNES